MKFLFPLVLILGLAAAALHPPAFGEEGEGESPSEAAPAGGFPAPETPPAREVPEPPVPGLEMPPAGLVPGSWTTWAAGQDVDRMPRINLRISGGIVIPFGNAAGSGIGAPSYDDIFETGPGSVMELGYGLTPALEPFVAFLFLDFEGRWYEHDDDPSTPEMDFEKMSAFSLFAGLKLRAPLSLSTKHWLRFSRIPAATGVSVYLKLGIGYVHLDGLGVNLNDGSGNYSWSAYFESSENLILTSRWGLEYQFLNLGFFLEMMFVNLGTPSQSNDPMWTASSKASPLNAMVFLAGLGVQF